MKKENQGYLPIDALTDKYAAGLAELIATRRVPLQARDVLPKITNTINLDLSKREVKWVGYNYTGKAIITDLMPKTVPVLTADTKEYSAKLKYISFGVETDADEEQEIIDGIVKPADKLELGFRIVAEQENSLLFDGFTKLGMKGANNLASGDGIHIVAAGKTWATASGEEIIEDIRKMRVALITGMKFKATDLALPQELDFYLDKTYTGTGITPTGVTTREVLTGRGYFDNYISIVGLESPMGMDKSPSNFGYLPVKDIGIKGTYTEGMSKTTVINEKISEFMLLQPESIVKLTGAN